MRQAEMISLAKSQSLFTSLIGGTANALNKLGFGNLSQKMGLDAAKKKAEEIASKRAYFAFQKEINSI